MVSSSPRTAKYLFLSRPSTIILLGSMSRAAIQAVISSAVASAEVPVMCRTHGFRKTGVETLVVVVGGGVLDFLRGVKSVD